MSLLYSLGLPLTSFRHAKWLIRSMIAYPTLPSFGSLNLRLEAHLTYFPLASSL